MEGQNGRFEFAQTEEGLNYQISNHPQSLVSKESAFLGRGFCALDLGRTGKPPRTEGQESAFVPLTLTSKRFLTLLSL